MTDTSAHGYKNCRRCTRWRPVSDYGYVVHRRGQYGERLYVRHVCDSCIRKAHTEAARNRDEFAKEYQKRWAEQKRRENGSKPKRKTGLKSKRDQSRESKRRKRRAEGIPPRPIGKRNHGYYGGQRME